MNPRSLRDRAKQHEIKIEKIESRVFYNVPIYIHASISVMTRIRPRGTQILAGQKQAEPTRE